MMMMIPHAPRDRQRRRRQAKTLKKESKGLQKDKGKGMEKDSQEEQV